MAPPVTVKPILKHAALVAAVAVVLVVLLPLLGAAALVTRVAVFVAVPVALVALALSPGLRAWLTDSDPGEVSTYKGLRLATGLVLHPAHAWARRRGRRVRVGVDDLLQRALGPVDEVVVPQPGRHVEQGEPLFTLVSGERSVAVRSPVTGTVERANAGTLAEPSRVNRAPYDAGWTLEVRPDDLDGDAAHLRRRDAAARWFHTEIDRFVAALSPVPEVAFAQEGGDLVADAHRLLDADAWQRVRAAFFDDASPST